MVIFKKKNKDFKRFYLNLIISINVSSKILKEIKINMNKNI